MLKMSWTCLLLLKGTILDALRFNTCSGQISQILLRVKQAPFQHEKGLCSSCRAAMEGQPEQVALRSSFWLVKAESDECSCNALSKHYNIGFLFMIHRITES